MAKLYEAAGDYGSAGEWASKILATDEKVPTTAAKEIKEEMRLLLKQVVIKTKKMIINKKYRKWLPIPIIVGIVIIQTVAILSILGYHWLIEKG